MPTIHAPASTPRPQVARRGTKRPFALIHCRNRLSLTTSRRWASWRFHSNRPDSQFGGRYNDPLIPRAFGKVIRNADDPSEDGAVRVLEIADHVRSHRRAVHRANGSSFRWRIVYWLEGRPQEQGRSVVVRSWAP